MNDLTLSFFLWLGIDVLRFHLITVVDGTKKYFSDPPISVFVYCYTQGTLLFSVNISHTRI